MKNYDYKDFISTLNSRDGQTAQAINEYILNKYVEYNVTDIKVQNRNTEWILNYRKKPKVGKSICELRCVNQKLTMRFSLLSMAVREFLLTQNEFSTVFRNNVLKQIVCNAHNSCRSYGENNACQWCQHFWIDNRLIKACPYPWIYFTDIDDSNLEDIKKFIDLQMKHMTQNTKDIKGSSYTEENKKRCNEIKIVNLEQQELDIDTFVVSDYVAKPTSLEKYTTLYNLIPMGANNGLWYFKSNNKGNAYSFNVIPKGRYITTLISNPMTFSVSRVWNYLCDYLNNNNEKIKGIYLTDESIALFARFYKDNDLDCMEVYIPLE